MEEEDAQTGVNYQRPGYQKLLQAAKTNQIDMLVVRDLSRYGRGDLHEGLNELCEFLGAGCEIVAVADNVHISQTISWPSGWIVTTRGDHQWIPLGAALEDRPSEASLRGRDKADGSLRWRPLGIFAFRPPTAREKCSGEIRIQHGSLKSCFEDMTQGYGPFVR